MYVRTALVSQPLNQYAIGGYLNAMLCDICAQ